MRLVVVLTFTLSLFGLSNCAVNPVTGERELSIISPSQEVAIGTKNYIPYQQQQGGRYIVDPDLGRYVNEVGQRIAKLSDRPGLPYEFVVLNNSVPNAWALPGGKIAINRGLLVELEDEAQLAAVLSHEVVHVAGKHSVQKMQQAQLLGLGVMATAVATNGKDYGKAATIGAGIGVGLWSAKYGRDQELQSDSFGMKYMAKAGYDPNAAIELQETFVRLSQQKGQSNWLQGMFASHPPSQERVDRNRATAGHINNEYASTEPTAWKRNATGFEKAIAQLKKDETAYALHNKALVEVKNENHKVALSLLDQAIEAQPEEALFYATRGQILLSQKMDSRAAAAFTKTRNLNPEYFIGYLGLGLIEKKQKRFSQAKQNLLKSQTLLPTQSASYHLGELELRGGNKDAAIRYFSLAARQGGELGEKAKGYLQRLQPAPTPSTQPTQ